MAKKRAKKNDARMLRRLITDLDAKDAALAGAIELDEPNLLDLVGSLIEADAALAKARRKGKQDDIEMAMREAEGIRKKLGRTQTKAMKALSGITTAISRVTRRMRAMGIDVEG